MEEKLKRIFSMRKLIYVLLFFILSASIVIAQMQPGTHSQPQPSDKNNLVIAATTPQPQQNTAMPNNMAMPSSTNMSGNMLSGSAPMTLTHPITYPQMDNIKINIPTLNVTKMNGPNVAATGIDITYGYNFKSNVENTANFALNIKNIQVTNSTMPQLFNGSLSVNLNVTNINLDVLQQIVMLSNRLDDKNITDAQKDQIANQIMTLLPKLVTSSTAVTANKIFTNDKGALIANFALSYPANVPLPTTPETLYNNVKFTLMLKVSIPLLDSLLNTPPAPVPGQTPQTTVAIAKPPAGNQQDAMIVRNMMTNMFKELLASWIAQGYVTKTNTDYLVNIVHENGVYKINGKVVDLSAMAPGMTPLQQPGMKPAQSTSVQPMQNNQPMQNLHEPQTPSEDVSVSPSDAQPIEIGPEPNTTDNNAR